MKGIFSLVCCVVSLYSLEVFSARWVLEDVKLNVQSNLQDFKVIKQFKVGDKGYTVVETADVAQSSAEQQRQLFQNTRASRMIQDYPVVVLDREPLFEEAGSWTQSNPGWHMGRMKYDRLNPAYQGQGVVVAVVDTGVDITHPQLARKIWRNPGEIPNNNIDDDANGYIDDVNGWDFINGTPNVMDEKGHGTHCAGIIAADPAPNGLGRGAAPYATIMPLKVIGATNMAFLSDVAEAIAYGANNGARILSNSWGLYASWFGLNPSDQAITILASSINHAYYRGVVFVGSAGNDSLNLEVTNQRDLRIALGIPGLSNMIGVASGDFDGRKDVMSSFSNYGPSYIHFATPGSAIYSTIPGGQWASKSGTSMATPLFAGILARMVSKGYTWYDAANVLSQTVDPVAQPAYQGKVRFGFVDAEAALR